MARRIGPFASSSNAPCQWRGLWVMRVSPPREGPGVVENPPLAESGFALVVGGDGSEPKKAAGVTFIDRTSDHTETRYIPPCRHQRQGAKMILR